MGRKPDLLFKESNKFVKMDIETKKEKFTELIKPLLPKLERYALSVMLSRDEAKEIVSETLLIAFERFDTLKSEKAMLSFLFTIASRVRVDYIKTEKKTESISQGIADIYPSSEASAETLFDIKLLYEALGKLEKKMSEAIILFEITGLKIKEIATVQNSTVSAVKIRLFRGRRKLAKLLGAE